MMMMINSASIMQQQQQQQYLQQQQQQYVKQEDQEQGVNSLQQQAKTASLSDFINSSFEAPLLNDSSNHAEAIHSVQQQTLKSPIAFHSLDQSSQHRSPTVAAPFSSILSPLSPFSTPKGLLSLSFSQNNLIGSSGNNDSQGSQRFDSLFAATAALNNNFNQVVDDYDPTTVRSDEDEDHFYSKHFH